ncbi:MAG: hypothetical protein IPK33_09995 [Gemmatimonadetes bacterium]|nr:hypothetical protein [Gemmatimonadota bacterium]
MKNSANAPGDSVDQYLFISTRSVYADVSCVPMTNEAPVLTRENSPLKEGDRRSRTVTPRRTRRRRRTPPCRGA